MNRASDACIRRGAATTEERYYVVMGYFAELLWEFGAAEESLAALRSILTAATAHSKNDPRRP
jgi:hypothetical protein